MSKRYVLSQLMKTVFQAMLYVSLFVTYFAILSVTNPQMVNLSRTAATTMVTFAVIMLVMTYIYGGYELGVKKARSVFASLLIATLFADVITYVQLQIMNVNPANNDHLILFGEDFWLLMGIIVLQIGLIYFFVWLGYKLYFRINPRQRCCIVTSSQELANHVAQKLDSFRQKYQLCEVLHYECPDLEASILGFDTIFLAGIPDTEEALLESYCYKHGKSMYLLAELEDVIISTAQQTIIDDTPFLYIHRVEPTLMQRFAKRSSDILLSILLLILTSPIMLMAAFCIFFAHNGPIFFKQKRATIGGKVFNIIKFRTMYVDACDSVGQSVCDNDNRITKIGRVLRKYRIDELPQLYNVLRGDMSMVGPRPEMLENVDKYTQEVPEFEYRKQMKAGLTGMAQIDGKYNTTPKDKVILDLLYIENFSLMLDVKLILRTVTVFFRRDSTEGFHRSTIRQYPRMRTESLSALNESKAQDATPLSKKSRASIEVSRENTPNETVLDASEHFSSAPKDTETLADAKVAL